MQQTIEIPNKMKMIPCSQCGTPMPELRLTQYGYDFCVNCSTVGAKRGIPVTRGTGDHTYTETLILDKEQYEEFVVASAIERGDKNAAKAEFLDYDKEDRNLKGPFRIINSSPKEEQ